MKYLLILILLSGCASNPFKVGKCVREIGSKGVEQITYIAPYGGIETRYEYSNGKFTLYTYNNRQRLIPVECE